MFFNFNVINVVLKAASQVSWGKEKETLLFSQKQYCSLPCGSSFEVLLFKDPLSFLGEALWYVLLLKGPSQGLPSDGVSDGEFFFLLPLDNQFI